MQGLLSDLPLLGVLELIHATRQTGVLEVQSDVPYTLAFVGGEIVSGGILDWLGQEALYASPMLPESGSFQFERKTVRGQPLAAWERVTSDWARVTDEWEEVCAIIGSPSRFFRGSMPLFDVQAGRSVRGAAREAELPVFQVARIVANAVQQGQLLPQARHEWFRLKLSPPRSRGGQPFGRRLNGQRTLGEIVQSGVPTQEARDYLLGELRLGLRFPGSGWVLRDLVWEMKHTRLKPPLPVLPPT